MNKLFKAILIIIGLACLYPIGYLIYVFYAMGLFDKDYSVSELKNSFEKNKTEIYELKKYYMEIVPKNRFIEIEFKDDNTLFRFGIKALDSTAGNPNVPMFLEWDLKTNSERMDSILKLLGWTKETLKILKEKLDNANCIQIESGEPTKIGFQRSGMSMYSFNIFEKPISDSLKNYYNDSCTYIQVNKKLVLEYGGGAVGANCFYNKE